MSEPRKFSDSSLAQLTLVRFREFIRQPEAVFWTFIFPVLLAVGLGLAFRSGAPERLKVTIVSSSQDRAVAQIRAALRADSTLIVDVRDDSGAARALRTGEVALLIVPKSPVLKGGSVDYVFDPQRGESRNARLIADRARSEERRVGKEGRSRW